MRKQPHSTVPIALLLIFLFSLPFAQVASATETFRLDNGMEVILKQNHASPMVSSMVFVRSGSKYESRFENGITHFLEHLLFDGTANLEREQIDGSIKDKGGYLNAFTRKELTAYLVLLPKQYIEYGMTIEADMLFNSVIPEEELPKERKVVIEEINRSADAPGYAAGRFFADHAYRGTDYGRPVLGYRPFIANIPRAAIVDYWRRFYIPRNMTLLIIGDFEIERMKKTVASVFGSFENPDGTADISQTTEKQVRPGGDPLAGQTIVDTVADVSSTYIDFSFSAPRYSDSAYPAFDLLTQYLDLDEVSPLKTALTSGADPLATEVSVSLATYEEFSRLEIGVMTDRPTNRDSIIATVLEQLGNVSGQVGDEAALDGIKVSIKCDEIYTSEKLHYYGFMIAPKMMTVGWDFIQTYAERLEPLQWADCQAAAGTWLDEPVYIATVVSPLEDSAAVGFVPVEMKAEDVIAHFDTLQIPTYDLVTDHDLEYPATESVSFEMIDNAEYHREVLPCGLTLLIKSSPDSRVFSMNVLGKNRSANESEQKAGITDFVNRCIEKGTTSRSASELSRDLAGIGANVTLYDNPWIPYDDRYTTRRFSFMKFETIDQFAAEGFDLFTQMLTSPAFDSAEVENVRRSMLSMLGRSEASTGKVARSLFYQKLFEGQPYSLDISGTPATIASITVEELKAHHARVYHPGNMIIAIASNRPVDETVSWVKEKFAGYQSVEPQAGARRPDLPEGIVPTHRELDKEQIAIFLGSTLPGAESEETAALRVATSILSQRLYLNLREKQGLAYSVGAGMITDRKFGWYYCTIGTAPENRQKALDGIMLEIEKLKLDGPTPAEVSKARNHIWGRLMAAKLSRINQAYYLCLNEFLGREMDFDQTFIKQLTEVSADSVRRVLSRYFRPESFILATAGKKL